METKVINDIEYIVYESGMILNNPQKSYYFEENLDYDGNVNCLHFYAIKDVIIRGYQDVRGNQDVRGYQYVGGYQDVRGNQDVGGNQYVGGYQYVRGNQYVRFIYFYSYCKYAIRIDRDCDNYKIGCVEKSESEWDSFFANGETINMTSDDRNYKKLAISFEAAKVMKKQLLLMNDKEARQ